MKTALIVGFLLGTSLALPVDVTPGNLLVSYGNRIQEHTRSGGFVQSFNIPTPGSHNVGDSMRDFEIDDHGSLQIFHGTENALLTSYSLQSGIAIFRPISGFSGYYSENLGQLAVYSNYVFMTTSGLFHGSSGLIRYDLSTGHWVKFAGPPPTVDDEVIDLAISSEGFLHTLVGDGAPRGRRIDIYNAQSLVPVRSINLEDLIFNGPAQGGVVDIEVGTDGSIYLLSGNIIKLNGDGSLADYKAYVWGLMPLDMDLSEDGTLMVTHIDGEVILIDADSLEETSRFQATSYYASGSFGAFVPHPPKGDFALISSKNSVAGENSCKITLRFQNPSMVEKKAEISDTSIFADAPISLTIGANRHEASFFVKFHATNADVTVAIRAKIGPLMRACTVTMKALIPSAIALTPNSVIGGQTLGCRVVLNGFAGMSGRTVNISDNSLSCVSPGNITIPPGSNQASFVIDTLPVTSPQNVTIRATVSAGVKTATLRITP